MEAPFAGCAGVHESAPRLMRLSFCPAGDFITGLCEGRRKWNDTNKTRHYCNMEQAQGIKPYLSLHTFISLDFRSRLLVLTASGLPRLTVGSAFSGTHG